jgi:hypothetical protein
MRHFKNVRGVRIQVETHYDRTQLRERTDPMLHKMRVKGKLPAIIRSIQQYKFDTNLTTGAQMLRTPTSPNSDYGAVLYAVFCTHTCDLCKFQFVEKREWTRK